MSPPMTPTEQLRSALLTWIHLFAADGVTVLPDGGVPVTLREAAVDLADAAGVLLFTVDPVTPHPDWTDNGAPEFRFHLNGARREAERRARTRAREWIEDIPFPLHEVKWNDCNDLALWRLWVACGGGVPGTRQWWDDLAGVVVEAVYQGAAEHGDDYVTQHLKAVAE